jgi:uncharacterized Zn-binding protein involved in type VI secretion
MKQRSIEETSATTNSSRAPIALPRKVVARFALATIGSRTSRGGEVMPAPGAEQGDDYRLACVGDRVRYEDGSESVITSGAGHASTFANKPIALVGSHVANGDRIIASRHSMGEIVLYEGDAPIQGLLQPGYVPVGLPEAVSTEEA